MGLDYDFDQNNFDNFSNVFSDDYANSDVLLMTGVPSLNTRYIKSMLNSLNGNILHFFLEDKVDVDYSRQIIIDEINNIKTEVDYVINDAVKFANESEEPSLNEIFTDILAE